jgi:hypothetical protein
MISKAKVDFNYHVLIGAGSVTHIGRAPEGVAGVTPQKWKVLPATARAPSASPTAASAKKSHDEEQQYRAKSGVHDCTDHTSTQMDTDPGQQPTSDKGAHYPDKEVANDSKTCPLHDFPSQPAGNDAHKQDDQ